MTVGDIDEVSFGVLIQADLAGAGASLDYVTIKLYLQDPGDDSDHDGTPDSVDSDDDGDGIQDTTDNCPTVPNSNQKNTDVTQRPPGDAMGDVCEHDDDNDTAPDGNETPLTRV